MTTSKPSTLYDKIWDDHVVEQADDDGEREQGAGDLAQREAHAAQVQPKPFLGLAGHSDRHPIDEGQRPQVVLPIAVQA